MLSPRDLAELVAFRHALHRAPDLSRHEEATARRVVEALQPTGPDRVVTGLGGHGVAAVYQGPVPGPTVMVRCELDGLPIQETSEIPHRSSIPGKGHLCGHDGHMATLVGLARLLGADRPRRGRAVLLFQPAEEDGSGAAAVIADPRFAEIAPDWAFALHNMPGIPLGAAALAPGPANCASRGLAISFSGKTSHASQPEAGISPARALARLIPALEQLGPGGETAPGFRLVTITHARMGEPAFGISPGEAELWVTLRTLADDDMTGLVGDARRLIEREAAAHGLAVSMSEHDVFHACTNDPQATSYLMEALNAEGIAVVPGHLPMRASEDFGLFGRQAKSAMFLLGAGEDHPRLHNPDYDYPDALIGVGVGVLHRALRDVLENASKSPRQRHAR
nr:amidohydrolase [Alsobacter ponti]